MPTVVTPPYLIEEQLYELSKQEILIVLQTILRIAFCRLGMCADCIGNYTDIPVMRKVHH